MRKILEFWPVCFSLGKISEKDGSFCRFSKCLLLWGDCNSPLEMGLWSLLQYQNSYFCLSFLPPAGVTFFKYGNLSISPKAALIQTAGGNQPWERSSQLSSEALYIPPLSALEWKDWFQIQVFSWCDVAINNIRWKETRVTLEASEFSSWLKCLLAVWLWANPLCLCSSF